MNSLPENFCIAPFTQCTTHPSKSFSPCPYLGGTVWPGEYGNIHQQWTSQGLADLRADFLDNKQSPICNRCWHEEKNGKRSLRLRLLDPETHHSDFAQYAQPNTVERLLQKITTGAYLKGPETLTIKNGNVCNARCRTCHPGDSSRWIADAKRLKEITGKDYHSINKTEINWSPEQLEEIYELSKNLSRLELFGGEPVYNKQVNALVERIAQSDHCNNITLYINTNGSVDITKRMPSVHKFHAVEIGVSIDAVEEHFNYIRNGVEFQTVLQNIKIWQNYFEQHDTKYFIDSISTVQIQNIFYLPELKSKVMEVLPLAPYWNLLVEPEYLFIKNMPDNIKQAVINKLSVDDEFDDIISVINQPADLHSWENFLEVTHALDIIRGEDFAKTFPEFHTLIVQG